VFLAIVSSWAGHIKISTVKRAVKLDTEGLSLLLKDLGWQHVLVRPWKQGFFLVKLVVQFGSHGVPWLTFFVSH